MEKLEVGKIYKIGKYYCEVGTTGSKKFYLANSREGNSLIYSQFNIERSEIESITGNKHEWGFPECNTLEDLQRVYEYIMSKDPANKNKTVNVRDIKYPDQIHITSKEQWEKIVKYYSKIHPYNPENKYYLADRSGSKETPFTGPPARIAGQDFYNTYEFEDIIFPEEKQIVNGKGYYVGQKLSGWLDISDILGISTEKPEKELGSLPEKWCIKDIKEVKNFFEDYNIGSYTCEGDAYLHYPKIGYRCYFKEIQSSYTEITYEQFKKWVMKEETQSDIKEWDVNTYVVITGEYHSTKIGEVHKIQDNETHYIDITKSVGKACLPGKKDCKWFATKEEAEKFSLSLSTIKEWTPEVGEWCYYMGPEAGGTDTGKGYWEKGLIAKFESKDTNNTFRFSQTSSKYMINCSNKACAFRKATQKEIDAFLKSKEQNMKSKYYIGQSVAELNPPNRKLNVWDDSGTNTLNRDLEGNYNLNEYLTYRITELKDGYFAIGNWGYKWFKISELEGIDEKPNIQAMEQFKIGDWVYSECLDTGPSKGIGKITKIDKEDSRQPYLRLNIKGRGEIWSYGGYQRLATKDEIPSDTTNSSLKVNDWVVVTERYATNDSMPGMVGQLTRIDVGSMVPYQIGNCKDFSGKDWCKNVRKAEPWEIPNTIRITQEIIINSSPNVAHATKGQLPLYEVKKRVVLN